jgi:TRAP-type C4-dicarboxylate transport system permease small subunit
MAGRLVEGLCLVLMVVLSVDILLGVFSRYVVGQTFTWYDEIARACFVWLVFLGAAVGVKRGAHFRLHLLVGALPSSWRRGVEGLGILLVIGFGLVLVRYGWVLVELGRYQRTPVMNLPKSWIYLAVPAGGALMIVHALPGLGRAVRGRDV